MSMSKSTITAFVLLLSLIAIATPACGLRRMSHASQLTLRQMVMKQLSATAVRFPRGTVCSRCLLRWVHRTGATVKGKGSVSEMQSYLRRRLIPQAVINRLRVMAFAGKTKFQIFTFNVNRRSRYGRYQTYIAAARRTSARSRRIEFGVVTGVAWGSLVRKTRSYRVRRCRRILFFKRCRTRRYHVTRGNTAHELKLIERALRAYVYHRMRYEALRHFR